MGPSERLHGMWVMGCCRHGVSCRAGRVLRSLHGGAVVPSEAPPSPVSPPRRGRGKQLTQLSTNHSISVPRTPSLGAGTPGHWVPTQQVPSPEKLLGRMAQVFRECSTPRLPAALAKLPHHGPVPRVAQALPSKATASQEHLAATAWHSAVLPGRGENRGTARTTHGDW